MQSDLKSPPACAPRINTARLRALLDGVNAFGRNAKTGGANRPGFSEADMAAREWFAERMRGDGFLVWRDGAANLFGRFGPADGPCVMAGSHLDTVPEGGAFDGALGACAALECARTMQDAGLRPKIAVEVVATSEEEGRFGGMFGSRAMAGLIDREWLGGASDTSGVFLADAMRARGLEPDKALKAARDPRLIRAFLELHIEQGPILEAEGLSAGVVESVSGVGSLLVCFNGRANHSGTTPMGMRADAFAGLAQVGAAIPKIIAECGGDRSRVTIGKAELRPNFPRTVPGAAEFSVDIRDADERVMRALSRRVRDAVAAAARANNLTATVEEKGWLSPVALDAELVALLREQAESMNLPFRMMSSGAGHDAQTMQALCPSALIFVPSRDGISHAPEEHSDWEDIEKGANLLLSALTRLSGAME